MNYPQENYRWREHLLTNNEGVISAVEGSINSLVLVVDGDGVSKGGGPGDNRGRRGEGGSRGDKDGGDSELHFDIVCGGVVDN